MQLSVLVSADYVLQVSMSLYRNDDNSLPNHECCDHVEYMITYRDCNGEERCDNYFTYCLLPHSSTATECPNNGPGFTAVSSVSPDGVNVDFSQPNVFGLPYPFNLTGITTAWEVKNYCLYSISN